MKLKKFNRENVVRAHRGTPTIRFSPKTGLISFSTEASKVLELSDAGGRVELLQNQEAQKDWYIHVTKNDAGFPLRCKDKSHSFNSVSLCQQVLKSLEPDRLLPGQADVSKGATFRISSTPISQDGMRLYFIITSKPL